MKKKDKIKGVVFILFLSVSGLLLWYFNGRDRGASDAGYEEVFTEVKSEAPEAAAEEKPALIVADIKGAVKNPREYSLPEGSRVRDLIESAGGLIENADENRIYYSKILCDEDVIKIYLKGEEEDNIIEGSSLSEESSKGKTVNINKATSEELQTLPGIGKTRAESILAYREQNGKFKSVDELANIDGIGSKTLDKLRYMVDIK